MFSSEKFKKCDVIPVWNFAKARGHISHYVCLYLLGIVSENEETNYTILKEANFYILCSRLYLSLPFHVTCN